MNRRHFIQGTAALVATSALLPYTLRGQAPTAMSTPTPTPPVVPEFRPLRRNVGLFTARGGTIGWLANEAGVIAVDTQFPETAPVFFEGLPGRAGRSLDLILNTHHHGDHTGGNAVLRAKTGGIVAHANVPALMRAAAERNKQPLKEEGIPDITYPETWRKDVGDETVSTRYFGPGHTKGDVVVLFEKANVVHMGDLLFNRVYPVIDRPGGAQIKAWIPLLERVVKEYPADAIYIAGHGAAKFGVTVKREELLVLRDYLTALLDYTGKAIREGKPKETIVALENFPGFPDFHQNLPNRLGANLGVAFDELSAG